MWVGAYYKKVNATSTEARLAPVSCTCVRTAFYCVAVIFLVGITAICTSFHDSVSDSEVKSIFPIIVGIFVGSDTIF